MKTKLTSAEIIAAHGPELDHAPFGCGETIREMLEAEPDTEWTLVDEQTAPNGAACPTYATRKIGDAGPAVLVICDAVEPIWETEREAEDTLAGLRVLEAVAAAE